MYAAPHLFRMFHIKSCICFCVYISKLINYNYVLNIINVLNYTIKVPPHLKLFRDPKSPFCSILGSPVIRLGSHQKTKIIMIITKMSKSGESKQRIKSNQRWALLGLTLIMQL